ncbi:MAG: secretin and TonB N-terminal domain-containing protein, partial [Nitrospinae bacterium]|nr:secretin and TonB N-terminal domain-containing protein [Nitrospinota bacterium]
ILRILADVSGFNIITSDTVKGTVTMKLRNVPWDQALDVILRNNGLDKIQEGNIIRVATRGEIQAEKEATEKI